MNRFKRINIKGKIAGTVIFALIAALMYLSGVGCLFRYFIHIPCPSCGLTRAVICLLRLDIKGAIHYNYMVFSVPYIYLFYLLDGNVIGNKKIDILIMIIILILFLLRYLFIIF